jgi:transcriptional regulator with XRE-family HTH domain
MNNGPKAAQPYDAQVGARIRAERMARGISQSELAEACGITFQQVQKYEKGSNRISIARARQIAEKLEVPATQLLGEISNPSVTLAERIGGDRLGVRLLQAYGSIRDEIGKRKVVELVEHFAGQMNTTSAAIAKLPKARAPAKSNGAGARA